MGAGKDLWLQFETLYSQRYWDGAAALFADDAVHVDPTGRQEGREAIRVWCEQGGAAFSDISFPASLLMEDGDTVVAEYVFRAMFTGPLIVVRQEIEGLGGCLLVVGGVDRLTLSTPISSNPRQVRSRRRSGSPATRSPESAMAQARARRSAERKKLKARAAKATTNTPAVTLVLWAL